MDRRTYIRIAHWYYELGLTQEEIGKRLQIPRQRVNKIVNTLVEDGIVTIKINGLDRSLFADTEYGQLRIGLSGSYQAENAALALAAIRALHSRGFEIPAKAVCEGMDLARWPGRFELLRANPPLLLDGAHNPQGAQSLYDSLQTYYPGRRCVFLMAAMRDKDAAGCIRAVAPLARAMVAVPLPFPRAYAAPQLAALMLEHCKTVYTAASIEDGLRTALSLAQPDDIVCAFGSLYMADRSISPADGSHPALIVMLL